MPKIEDVLANAGLRPTSARVAVLELLRRTARPMSHADLKTQDSGAQLDRVTIYRSLSALLDAGLVHRIQGPDGAWRYCAHSPKSEGCPAAHPHFACTECGALRCLADQPLPWVALDEGERVTEKHFIVYGVCKACAAQKGAEREPGPRSGATSSIALLLCLLLWSGALGWLSSGCRSEARGAEPDDRPYAGRSLELFLGAASRRPMEELLDTFERESGAALHAHFGSSGAMLSQMKLSGRGDLYLPGSPDYLRMAEEQGLVVPDTERRVAYLVPALTVQPGNPRGIRSLADLSRPGLRVGLARPDSVAIGRYSAELLEYNGLGPAVQRNVVTYSESCAKTSQQVVLGAVDAALNWRIEGQKAPERMDTVLLPPAQVPRLSYLAVALASSVQDRPLALEFVAFLGGPRGQEVFRRRGYLVDLAQARRRVSPEAEIGGEWPLPERWR